MFCWLRLLHARESAAWLVCNLRTKLLEEDCNCWGLLLIKTDVVNNLPRCKFFEHRLIGESGAPIMQRIESINAQRIQQQTAFNDQTWKEFIDAQLSILKHHKISYWLFFASDRCSPLSPQDGSGASEDTGGTGATLWRAERNSKRNGGESRARLWWRIKTGIIRQLQFYYSVQ